MAVGARDPGDLMSTEQVAEILGVRVRTVRRYIREGRLPAARIGKQYRVHRQDLEAWTGAPLGADPAPAPRPYVDVSSIVDISPIDREAADRVTRTVMAAIQGREHEPRSLRVDAAYDTERSRLKVIATGSLASTAVVVSLIARLLED